MINVAKKYGFPTLLLCLLIGIYIILLFIPTTQPIPNEGDMGFVEQPLPTMGMTINGQAFDMITAQPNQYFDIDKLTTEVSTKIEFTGDKWFQYNITWQNSPVETM